MKEKTSITLSKNPLAKVDRLAGSKHSRSAFIERVLREYLRDRPRAAVHARALARINRAADRLNLEASEVLEADLTHYVGSLSLAKRAELRRAVKIAIDLV